MAANRSRPAAYRTRHTYISFSAPIVRCSCTLLDRLQILNYTLTVERDWSRGPKLWNVYRKRCWGYKENARKKDAGNWSVAR